MGMKQTDQLHGEPELWPQLITNPGTGHENKENKREKGQMRKRKKSKSDLK